MHRTTALLLLLLAACSTPIQPIRLRTAPAVEPACDAALAMGTLAIESASGLGLDTGEGRVLPVIWPFGYTARTEGAVVVLVDPAGTAIARVGQLVDVGGSVNKAGELVACTGSVRVVPPPG